MVVCEWHIRDYDDEVNEAQAYRNFLNYFSLKIRHEGFFSDTPNKKYKNGKFNYIDQVDVDLFSVIELNEMVQKIGYKRSKLMYYHFKIPNSNLDYGLQALGNDQDVLNLLKYTEKYKLIEVYIEHDSTDLETYMKSPRSLVIEELADEPKTDLVKKRATKKRNRLPLLLTMEDGSDEEDNDVGNANVIGQGSDVGNDNVIGQGSDVGSDMLRQAMNEEFDPFFGEPNGPNTAPTTAPIRNDNYVEMEHDEDSDKDSDMEVSSEYDNDSNENDSDFIDDEHVLNEVDVDMKAFYEHIDKVVEWIGCSNGNVAIPVEHNVEEGYYLDDFDSASDTELEGARNKALRNLRKEHEKPDCVDNIAPFYVGKEFPEKDSDRQKGIKPAIARVFPCAKHRFCVRHIYENMKLQWKGRLRKDLVWKCASATTIP